MKNIFSDKIILVESLVIVLPMMMYFIIGIQNKDLYPEFLINVVFLVLVVALIIFRSNSIRHMYFGFIFLFLTIAGNLFGWYQFIYITGSLALSLFFLGVLNMIFFSPKN